MISVGTDITKCASVHQPIYWNVYSLYQYGGTTCLYWKWACNLNEQLLFTVDARAGGVYLAELPESFGPERHKVHQINCLAGKAATSYFDGLDTSNMTIIGGEHATVDIPTIPASKAKTNIPRDESAYHPGDTTICDAPNFHFCTDNNNAMDRCSSFDPAAGGPTSLKQYGGAVCKWYRGTGCSRESLDTEPMKLDSRAGQLELPHLGADNELFKSVECKQGDW